MVPALPPSDDPTEVQPSRVWIRDSRGYGSVTLTLTVVAFCVTTISYIISMVGKIGPVEIRAFDVGACSAYFVPILTLYATRKFTEAKFAPPPAPAPQIQAAAPALQLTGTLGKV